MLTACCDDLCLHAGQACDLLKPSLCSGAVKALASPRAATLHTHTRIFQFFRASDQPPVERRHFNGFSRHAERSCSMLEVGNCMYR
eukprot:13379-Heterococcus_DN1.PRE.2